MLFRVSYILKYYAILTMVNMQYKIFFVSNDTDTQINKLINYNCYLNGISKISIHP